jgi:hypothetical protein
MNGLNTNINPFSCLNRALPFLGMLILFCCQSPSLFAQKNDTLYFRNGDRISGEIRKYKYGYLTYKTYGVGTVDVKYDKISTFFSRKSFDIIMKEGSRRFGSFDTSNVDQVVKIITTNDTLLTPFIEIVEFTPIKKRFWSRLSGSIDLGFSYTKANTISQLTFSSDVKYTERNYLVRMNLYSLNSIQTNQDNLRTQKNDATLYYYRRLRGNWLGFGSGSAEQNSELGLQLRLQTGAGIANEIIHTNSNNLITGVGFFYNSETSTDTTGQRINYDLSASVQYRLFLFHRPEISLTSTLYVFPSLSVKNRYRLNYDIDFQFKIIADMYLSFSFYINYDSKPPSTGSATDDYSFTSSFGYKF